MSSTPARTWCRRRCSCTSWPRCRRPAATEILGNEHAYQGCSATWSQRARRDGLARPDVEPRLAALSILGSANWVGRWFRPDGPHTAEEIGAHLADMAVRAIATPEALIVRDGRRAAVPAAGE